MKKLGNSDVTVVIPTLNEEENMAEVMRELDLMGYNKILVVDADSTDRTVEIAKEYGAIVIPQKGRGKGSALRQVFEHDGLDSDAIITIDADGSMKPEEIPRFIEALDSGADLVKGSRFLPSAYSEDMNLIRKIGNRFFLWLVNLLWSANYTDLCYGFAAFRRDALKKLCPDLKSTNFEIETEILIKARKFGLKITEVPSIELRRRHGKSNLSILRDGFRILRTIIDEFVSRSTASSP